MGLLIEKGDPDVGALLNAYRILFLQDREKN